METFLAVLMALGVYLVGPMIFGFTLVGIVYLVGRFTGKIKRAEELEEAIEDLEQVVAEAKQEEHVKTTTR